MKKVQVEIIKRSETCWIDANISLVAPIKGFKACMETGRGFGQVGRRITLNVFKQADGKYSRSYYPFRDLRAEISKGLTLCQIEKVHDKIAEMIGSMKVMTKNYEIIEV